MSASVPATGRALSSETSHGDVAATIAANLAAVQARIAAAARRHGRRPEDVTLVAVSKTHAADAVLAAAAAGQMVFGENRVQEAAGKFATVREGAAGVRLHLVGSLQTNKAVEAVRIADVIESLDRPRLADALERTLAERPGGRAQPGPSFFVQVNTGDESQKGGVARAEAERFIEACRSRFGDRLLGLMCVPPAADDPVPHFTWLAELARRLGLAGLSMGMSGDFEAAIGCGATHVRVGSAIFGARPHA